MYKVSRIEEITIIKNEMKGIENYLSIIFLRNYDLRRLNFTFFIYFVIEILNRARISPIYL